MFTMRTQSSLGRDVVRRSPDGQTFVMTYSGEEDRAAEQVSLENWFDELKRLASSTGAGSNWTRNDCKPSCVPGVGIEPTRRVRSPGF